MIRKGVPILMCAVFCVLLVTPVLAYNAFRDGNFESWTGPWTLQGYDSYGWGVWVSESDWSYLGPANLADGVYQSPSHSFRSFGSNPMSIWQTIAWGGGPITYYVSSSGSYTVTVNEVDSSSYAKTGAVSFGPMILNETISPENVSAKTLNASEINMTTGIAVSSARSSWQQRNFTPSGSPRSLVVTFTTTTPNLYIDDIYTDRQLPVANFTGSPTSGTAPLTVQFSDTSTGTPTSWSWSFGDGGTSAVQNASHTYTSAGTYTVNLTVANAAGNNTVTKEGYVTVSQTQFYVFAEGVGLYHGTQDDLSLGNETPEDFYDLINGQCGTVDTEKCWNGRGLYVDDAAGSVHWNASEQAGSYADNADFALFVGHGANDRIYFGTPNSALELERSQMSFSGTRAKWVTFFACNVLNESTQSNWESVFNGIHIVNGFDTIGLLYSGQGTVYAQKLTGGGAESRKTIRDAWREMLQETINKEYIKGAYMWADPCGSDYLPGFGAYCSAPTTDGNGNYDISWDNFTCVSS